MKKLGTEKRGMKGSRIKVGKGGWFIAFLAGAVAATPFGVAVSYIDKRPSWAWPLVAVVGLVALVYALYQEHRQGELSEQLDSLRGSLIMRQLPTLILNYLRQALGGRAPEQGYRSNLMLIDHTTGQLVVHYYYPSTHQPDLDLNWDKWVGCCGHAWGSKEVTVCNLKGATGEDLREKWKLVDERYKRVTSSVGAIISYPIRRPNRPDIVAVLNCDSSLALAQTNFDTQQFKKEMEQIAEAIGRTLDDAGII